MIYHELRDIEDDILSSNLDKFSLRNIFHEKEKENITINKVKNIYRKYDFGTVRLIVTEDELAAKSSRISSQTADAYSGMILTIKKIRDDSDYAYTILRHNLVTTHTKLQGEVESVVPESELMRCEQHSDQIDLVKKSILSNTENTVDAFLEIIKRVVDLQAQIKGFEILEGEVDLDIGIHNIKRVLLNILYPYYEEFKKVNVSIYINIPSDSSDQYSINIDYQIFNIAMHHFLNNIIKYAKPYSKVTISFDESSRILKFSMLSIKINKDELKSIFELRTSGKNVGELAGDGVGMYMVKKALFLLNSRIEILPDYHEYETIQNIPYVRNNFLIYLAE